MLITKGPTGTDHPFFPPLTNEQGSWLSVSLNNDAVGNVLKGDPKAVEDIMGRNAIRILDL